jgi:hypothetical protein
MQDMFARWDVVVTDKDPGDVPHLEAVFGGSPQDVGMPAGVGGVSPFTYDCGIIESSIVFTFTNVFPNDAQLICEVMAQEIAHSYGLDHEMLASDPMSYLDYSGDRSFKDRTVPCGEYESRACGIGGSSCRPNQNSVQLLNQRLGEGDIVAPMLAITSPAHRSTQPPGFEVAAVASDNIAVTVASLYVDDVLVESEAGPGPYTFTTDTMLPDGEHVVRVDAFDGRNIQREEITVHVSVAGMEPDDDDGGCSNRSAGGLALGPLVAFRIRRRRRY